MSAGGPRLPFGFGTVPQPARDPGPPGDPIALMVKYLAAIANRIDHPPVSRQVIITGLAANTAQFEDTIFGRDMYNTLLATVKTGELWIYFGNQPSPSGAPDIRLVAGSTQQYAIPPNVYGDSGISFIAIGGSTDARVTLSWT